MDKLEDKSSKKENKRTYVAEVEHNSCAICLNLLNRPIITPCNHAFCVHCFEECAELSIKRICPLCRFEIPKTFIPTIDKEYTKKLVELFPNECKEREKQLAELKELEKQFLKLKVNYGNTWKEVPHPLKKGEKHTKYSFVIVSLTRQIRFGDNKIESRCAVKTELS